ncbi:MAG TPA: 2-amino-4-hydroxy-6-hydroxymethyldihydropteridine diphosphokinase [Solirubrobacteraceae bacterium]|nr:2-amino-4-hydroxy-6-hydroxymethyldihydropteridine diphosphokinase [Solirubrobacteraceae bacterium]
MSLATGLGVSLATSLPGGWALKDGRLPPGTALLGLGSNLGERRERLRRAVDALQEAGLEVLASSCTYDTDPVGEVIEQPSFLNACLLVRTDLEALELLDTVKRLERELGRTRDEVRHGPRAIDIDLLLVGDRELEHPRLKLPHAQLPRRRFVLIPALELDFGLRLPDGTSLADALAGLSLEEGVRWAGPPLALAGAPAPR